jgi:hypothetical protein
MVLEQSVSEPASQLGPQQLSANPQAGQALPQLAAQVPGLLQASAVQLWPSSQSASPSQAGAEQEPPQHKPDPPPQEVSSATGAFRHAAPQVKALVQLSVVHSLPSSQSAVPLQAGAAHEPAQQRPVPPPQEVSSATSVCSQLPALQVSLVHSLPSSQSVGPAQGATVSPT